MGRSHEKAPAVAPQKAPKARGAVAAVLKQDVQDEEVTTADLTPFDQAKKRLDRTVATADDLIAKLRERLAS